MPRLRDVAEQHFFKMDRRADHESLNSLFDATAHIDLIQEEWDFLARSLRSKSQTAPRNVIVQRLAKWLLIRSAGWISHGARPRFETIFILRYLSDPELNRWLQLRFNPE
jgi:TnpA family transposase